MVEALLPEGTRQSTSSRSRGNVERIIDEEEVIAEIAVVLRGHPRQWSWGAVHAKEAFRLFEWSCGAIHAKEAFPLFEYYKARIYDPQAVAHVVWSPQLPRLGSNATIHPKDPAVHR